MKCQMLEIHSRPGQPIPDADYFGSDDEPCLNNQLLNDLVICQCILTFKGWFYSFHSTCSPKVCSTWHDLNLSYLEPSFVSHTHKDTLLNFNHNIKGCGNSYLPRWLTPESFTRIESLYISTSPPFDRLG